MDGRYELGGLISHSGGGMIHRGWDRQSRREVIIKRAASGDAGGQAALRREASLLQQVSHPCVVAFLDSGTDDEGAYMIMELAGGQTLEEVTARQPLDLRQFEHLVTQTLEGIATAHARGVLHLDLKPQNIMVAQDERGGLRVKLLDFGVAQTITSSDQPESDAGGPVMGSLFFMAPERFDRAPVDVRADLYSLGCVYYQALAGRPPFEGATGSEVMVAHIRHQFCPLADVRTDLPAFVPQWVEWLMSRHPEERPATALDALDAFREQRTGARSP